MGSPVIQSATRLLLAEQAIPWWWLFPIRTHLGHLQSTHSLLLHHRLSYSHPFPNRTSSSKEWIHNSIPPHLLVMVLATE